MTAKQAKDALAIQNGACNPRGIARALVESLDADGAAGPTPMVEGQRGWPRTSPATRLILHQLIFILVGQEFGTVYRDGEGPDYHADTVAVNAAAEGGR